MTTSDEANVPDPAVPESSGRIDLGVLAALAMPGSAGSEAAVEPDADPTEEVPAPDPMPPPSSRSTRRIASVTTALALLSLGSAIGHAIATGLPARLFAAAPTPVAPVTIELATAMAVAHPSPAVAPPTLAVPAVAAVPAVPAPVAVTAPPVVAAPSADDGVALAPARARAIAPARHAAVTAPVAREAPSAAAPPSTSSAEPPSFGPIEPPAWPDEDETAPVAGAPAPAADEPAGERDLDALLERATVPIGFAPTTSGSSEPALPERPARADAEAALEALTPEVRACAAGAHGHAVVTIVITGETGRVLSANVTGELTGTPAGSCIARAARGVRFPPFARDRFSIAWPFAL